MGWFIRSAGGGGAAGAVNLPYELIVNSLLHFSPVMAQSTQKTYIPLEILKLFLGYLSNLCDQW